MSTSCRRTAHPWDGWSVLLSSTFVLVLGSTPAQAQTPVWNDEMPGGVITGSFTLGVHTFGTGSFEMPIPPGSTIDKAIFFAAQSGSGPTTVNAELNTVPYEFDLTDQA